LQTRRWSKGDSNSPSHPERERSEKRHTGPRVILVIGLDDRRVRQRGMDIDWHVGWDSELSEFACDSPLEGAGFEPSVPLKVLSSSCSSATRASRLPITIVR
jgi:hypothetical protein